MGRTGKDAARNSAIKAVQTPLGFYVLALFIVEGTLALVLGTAGLDQPYKWYGFLCMIGAFLLVILIVSILVFFFPKNLVFGKEEYVAPQIEPSALRDQIEDIIDERVKPECRNPAKPPP